MERIHICDKDFVLLLRDEEIQTHVAALAQSLNSELAGENPLFIVVLNGAFMFAADLLKRITIPCEVQFVKYESYVGTATTGTVRRVIGATETLRGRTVVVVEDIVDSGLTMEKVVADLRAQQPTTLRICSLFVKRDSGSVPIALDYPAIELGNKFVVGYGLDYNQQGRTLRNLYVLATDD